MANNYLKEYPLNGIIYIDAEPNICSTQNKKRNGEDNIGVEYLKNVNYTMMNGY